MKRLVLVVLAIMFTIAPALARVIPVYIPQPMEEPTPTKPVVGDYTNIHTVAVLLLLGDQMSIGRRHYIASLQMGTRDISEWKLNDQTLQALRRYLGSRYTVKDLEASAASRLDIAAFSKDLTVPFTERAAAYRKHLASLADGGFDAFVVVRKAAGDGSGIYYAAPVDKLYANYFIEIVDARDFTVIGSSFSRIQEPGWKTVRFPLRDLPRSVNFDSDFKTSAKEWELLHRETVILMRRSLVETLRSLEMGLTLPPPNDSSLLQATDEP